MNRSQQIAEVIYACSVVTSDGCLEWTGGSNNGYGWIMVGGEQLSTHRTTWEAMYGPIPEGLVLDHLVCSNKLCCFPPHLNPTTRGANILRDSPMPNHVTYRTNVCARGHSMADAYIRLNGRRMCRSCQQIRDRKRRAR